MLQITAILTQKFDFALDYLSPVSVKINSINTPAVTVFLLPQDLDK